MENENIIDAVTTYQSNQLTISPLASGYLNETSKWAKFLAIVGFCMVGLIVIGALFAGTLLSSLGAGLPGSGFMITVIYLAIAVVYFFPIYYLFRFASRIRPALTTKSPQELESAFENLKSHYKYIGILMIITLSIYILIGGGALLTAAAF